VQVLQPANKRGLEALCRGEPFDFGGRKCELFKIGDRLFEPSGEEEIALRWQFAHKKFKHCCFMHLVLRIALQHCELIEIGQQCAIFGIHAVSSSNEKI